MNSHGEQFNIFLPIELRHLNEGKSSLSRKKLPEIWPEIVVDHFTFFSHQGDTDINTCHYYYELNDLCMEKYVGQFSFIGTMHTDTNINIFTKKKC